MRQCSRIAIPGALLLGAWALLALGGAAAQDKAAFDKAVAEQKAAALAHWKRVFEKQPPHHETKHFLIYGAVKEGTLREVGVSLEKVYTMVGKVLEVGKEEPWPGKLAVYLATETRDFNALVRAIERRRPEEDERSSYVTRSDTPHVIAGPGKEAADLHPPGEASAQIAAALLVAKTGKTAPEWVVEGFGRATAFRAAPAADLAAENQRAYALAVTGKQAAKAAWDGSLKGEEAAVVRASVIAYLAYSGRSSRFLPLLNGFRPGENQQSVTTDAAMAAANIDPARLNTVWQKWVKSLR